MTTPRIVRYILLLLVITPEILNGQEHVHEQPDVQSGLVATTTPGAIAYTQNRQRYVVEAARVEVAPTIDGVLDDSSWRAASLIESFIQQEPSEGQPATERTEVWIAFDSRNLYIALHAYDSEPAGVIATEMRRDSDQILNEDNFQIIIDSFNDYRNGYMFVTNPLGAKLEQQIYEEGEGGGRGNNSNVNRNWDGVWDAAARRTQDGWTAEIAIPTTTMRFTDSELQAWGVNFMRNIRRKNEQVFWAPIPKAYSLTRVSMSGTLTGLEGLSQGMDLKLKPFLTSGIRSQKVEAGASKNEFLRDAGLDARYGLTSSLNLDLTVNTDFAQVEVDEQQVNLTRFGLFFPEKRDFFLENAGLFAVGSQRREADLFFSRRIGLSESGQPVPILGGARLTGKVGSNSLALMSIQTDSFGDKPGDNFLVSRYSRDLFGRSRVGALFINKDARQGDHFNRTIAADATIAPTSSLLVNAYVAKTSTPGITTGDSSYYTRVGYRTPAWNLWGQFIDIQENFNAEVGFVPRKGIRTTQLHFNPTPRPGKFGIRMMNPMLQLTYTTDQNNRLVSRRLHHMVAFRLTDGTYMNFVYNHFFEQIDEPFRLQSVVIPPGTYRFGQMRFQFNSDPSRRLYERLEFAPQSFYGGFRKDWNAAIGFRANTNLSTELEYRRNDVRLPDGEFEVNLGTVRIDYAISPRMTLRSLLQYNSSTDEMNSSVRFNFIYRPGSDIYIVYNDIRLPESAPVPRDRQLVLKWSYLFSR